MLDWITKRRADRMGRHEIGARINGRVIPASERFMNVLRQRLAMLWDDPAIEPRVMLRAEWDAFGNELAAFLGEIRDEVIEGVEAREALDTFIRERMSMVKDAMIKQAETMIMEQSQKSSGARINRSAAVKPDDRSSGFGIKLILSEGLSSRWPQNC